jgi:prepilin-type processing-associated H-X9-DG protein
VIAIIAVLIGLLLPAVQKVRESANRMKCSNNLKQMGLALHHYHDVNNHLCWGYCNGAPTATFCYTGWQLQLLPYLEQNSLYSQSVTWLTANPYQTDTDSYPACSFQMSMFICPSNTRATSVVCGSVNYELTSYMGCTGTASNTTTGTGVLFCNAAVKMVQITDGTSNTIAVGERPVTGDLYYGWGFAPYGTGYGDGDTVLGSNDAYLALDMGDSATNVGFKAPTNAATTAEIDGAHYWSFHTGGANFLFCDGSVHFLPYSASNVFPQLCTRAGGEVFAMPF